MPTVDPTPPTTDPEAFDGILADLRRAANAFTDEHRGEPADVLATLKQETDR